MHWQTVHTGLPAQKGTPAAAEKYPAARKPILSFHVHIQRQHVIARHRQVMAEPAVSGPQVQRPPFGIVFKRVHYIARQYGKSPATEPPDLGLWIVGGNFG